MKYPNVKAEISRKGITAKELAERVGVSPVTFSNWMNGKSEPGIKNALVVAKELECSVEYLFAN